MDSHFKNLLNDNPELFFITKPGKSLIAYGLYNDLLIESVLWIYNNYLSKEVILFKNFDIADIENVKPSSETVVVFAYADIVFNELCKNNKRRFNTILKNINKKSKIIVLGYSNLKCLDLSSLDSFEYHKLNSQITFNYSMMDLLDHEIDTLESNVESFIEIVSELVSENKRIYISLNLTQQRIAHVFSKLKELGVDISKTDNPDSQVVINSCKTTEKTHLVHSYSVYIFILPFLEYPLDLIGYMKNSFGKDSEIYLDASRMENTSSCIKKITNIQSERSIVRDSLEFDSYNDLVKNIENPDLLVMASENYYCFEANDSLLKLNLNNMVKKDFDSIRNFIKIKLINKFDMDIKTCQLATPSSPKDRSRKLNSLSNKLSSFDYRCDITCEIFKDYSIGVIVWNETFANRKTLNLNSLKNNTFVYQTTNGKWKYTSVT